MSSVDVVVGVVLLSFRLTGLGVWQIPHVQLFRCLGAQSLLQVVGNLIGIDEVYIHARGNIARGHAVESVGVDERVTLRHFHSVLECLCAQLLVVVVLWGFHEEVSPHHTVHQHRYASVLTCLTNKLRQIVVEG